MENYKVTRFKKFSDKRGQLVVFLKKSELTAKNSKFGQIYFVTFEKKSVIRGNHYHKKWYEWFGVISGRLLVILENVKTKKRKEIVIDAQNNHYVRLEITPYTAHAFKSLTNYASMINYANGEWDKNDDFNYTLIES